MLWENIEQLCFFLWNFLASFSTNFVLSDCRNFAKRYSLQKTHFAVKPLLQKHSDQHIESECWDTDSGSTVIHIIVFFDRVVEPRYQKTCQPDQSYFYYLFLFLFCYSSVIVTCKSYRMCQWKYFLVLRNRVVLLYIASVPWDLIFWYSSEHDPFFRLFILSRTQGVRKKCHFFVWCHYDVINFWKFDHMQWAKTQIKHQLYSFPNIIYSF